MEPSTQLASCLCKECLCHCIVCGRNSTSVCCEPCTAELSNAPKETPLECLAYLRTAIASIEARQRETPSGPEKRALAAEWETIYLELLALETRLGLRDYLDRLMDSSSEED
jgi:hypothetical protein